MKHLRKFNEGKARVEKWRPPDKSEIYDLSRDYLAYLIDDNYSCDVETGYEWSRTPEKITSKLVTKIILLKYKNNSSKTEKFLWNDVKDHFIAFIHLLSKDYNIDNFDFLWVGLQQGSIVPVLRSSKRSLQKVLDDDNCDFAPLEKVYAVISKKE